MTYGTSPLPAGALKHERISMRMKRSPWSAPAALLAVALAAAMSASPASAAVAATSRTGQYAATAAAPQAGENMQYGGGPVQIHPVVYLVFWGSQWNTDTNGIPSYLTNPARCRV